MQGRNGLGTKAAAIPEARGSLVGALIVTDDDEVMCIRASGSVTRSRVDEVNPTGRVTMGVTFVKLDDGRRRRGRGPQRAGGARRRRRGTAEEGDTARRAWILLRNRPQRSMTTVTVSRASRNERAGMSTVGEEVGGDMSRPGRRQPRRPRRPRRSTRTVHPRARRPPARRHPHGMACPAGSATPRRSGVRSRSATRRRTWHPPPPPPAPPAPPAPTGLRAVRAAPAARPRPLRRPPRWSASLPARRRCRRRATSRRHPRAPD